jgi:hypothetical protein
MPPDDKYNLTSRSIIAIHGLDGHRLRSWTADNGVLWLRDLLPGVVPRARILTYGYQASTRARVGLPNQQIVAYGKDLITAVATERKLKGVSHSNSYVNHLSGFQISERPIIFIAHSLGGLVLKSVGADHLSSRLGF